MSVEQVQVEASAEMTLLKQREGGRVLVVDDESAITNMLVRILKRSGYSCASASSAAEALELMSELEYDVVLTDMDMPEGSGIDLIRRLRLDYPNVATLMVTGLDDTSLAHSALEVGAYGYIIKPFEANEVIINVANALRRRQLEIENSSHRARLQRMVEDRTHELWTTVAQLEQTERRLRLSQEETIRRLAIAAEYRDNETSRHIERMSRYCALLAAELGESSERVETLRLASHMHDVGKIGIPDSILLKPGPLTEAERTIMQGHAEIGYRILCDSQSELLNIASCIALTHHERYDGDGYPSGLAGTAIPIEGRIAAIADVFDALTSKRVYKEAVPMPEAIEIMSKERGGHFDPRLLDQFLSSIDAIVDIRNELAFA
jgi:putative two-component system response regulator